ncbi:MAG TPA: sarcosine oxidase subunit gamma family protein [Casimicrobiaceae bacterium]
MLDADVTLGEVTYTLAWNVRGDPAQSSFVSEVERLLGLPLPLQPNTSAFRAGRTLLWLGPMSWLLVVEPASSSNDFDTTRRALNAAGGALFDVSASYVGWMIAGPAAARVLNRTCPLDLHPSMFPARRCAQSMLGHINALLYKLDERPTFVIMVARSFAADVWRDLCMSATTDGYVTAPPLAFDKVARSID